MRHAFVARFAAAFGALPLILAACGGGNGAGSAPTSSAAASGRATAMAVEPATTKIVAEHSGKCLNVEGGPSATQDGARIIQWACNGASNEDWTLASDGNGHFTLVAKSSNKCVQPVAGGTANEVKLQQATCDGSPRQLWNIRPKASGGRYEIVHVAAGRCLDVTGGTAATADGVVTELWDCTGMANQSWALELPDGTVAPAQPLVALHSNKCLDVQGGAGATQDGAAIVQSSCVAGAAHQAWTVRGEAGGPVELVVQHSGKCLSVKDANPANEALIEQRACDGAASQRWSMQGTGTQGRYRFLTALAGGRCLDVRGGVNATQDGALLELWDCTGQNNQTWTLDATGGGDSGGQVLPQLNHGDTNWTLTFRDEFDGIELDRSKWTPQFGWLPQTQEPNWVVEDSKLKMWSHKDPALGKFYDRNIHTADKWYGGYGYYEARMKLNVGPGQWPAFWLYNNAQWPSFAPEIDIMEAYGGCNVEPWSVPNTCEPGTYESVVHRSDNETRVFTGGNANNGGSHRTQPGFSLASGFHTYGALYDETGVTLIFDGQQVGKLSGHMPASLFMILSLQNDPGRSDPSGEPIDDNNDWRNTKQNAFEIEYVRAWKRP
jgi:beta-glucanase (GH16 family)